MRSSARSVNSRVLGSAPMSDNTADRWPRIERLYVEALEQDPPAREAFLEAACEGDDELRREVRSLLRYESVADQFLGRPALVAAAQDLARAVPSLTGRQIAGYEVMALIGAGGMGDVYRARDLRLGRDVALKVLDPLAAFDSEYRRRFEEEAKSASGLNHPNISRSTAWVRRPTSPSSRWSLSTARRSASTSLDERCRFARPSTSQSS